MPNREQVVSELSRELALTCDAAGRILWRDDRARGLLGEAETLAALAAPGTGDKIARMLAEARTRTVSGWELILLAGGKARTFAFSATPGDGEVVLVGSLVPEDYGAALERQNASMSDLAALHRELQARNRELERVTQELGDAEKGVRVLHQELDDKAQAVLAAANVRAKALQSYSHELRTPINSILGISRLLLEESDGALNEEQKKQVGFVRRGAETLWGLVNDLLDASKLDARGAPLRISRFRVGDLFGALRGMLRPIANAPGVELSFEAPAPLPELETDEGKVSQILRNLVSNALKFTEQGTVRVRAVATDFGAVRFEVEDTGIGIRQEDLGRLFMEFSQVEGATQRRSVGSGLGLSISKRLAATLGGEIHVESHLGKGSTFTLTVPAVHPDAVEMRLLDQRAARVDPSRVPVLVVEDDRATLLLYERYLAKAGFQIIPARNIEHARKRLGTLRPAAVVLDVMLEDETTWSLLRELKANPDTRDVPVLVLTVIGGEAKARALGADEFALKPVEESWLQRRLAALARRGPVRRVLLVDDDESTRYLVRKHLEGTGYVLEEAVDGASGLSAARTTNADVVLLDFFLPDMTAIDVVDQLRHDERTRDLPVIVLSAQQITDAQRARLREATNAFIDKAHLSREEALSRIRDVLAKQVRAP